MASTRQEAAFGHLFLDQTIDWIRNAFEPDDVFDAEQLVEWARRNCTPLDVCSEEDLDEWAISNGYTK